MREIKYKAKSIKTNEWIYGYYVDEGLGNHLIAFYCEDENKVKSEYIELRTLCQYSGIKDRLGREIYERDQLWYCYMETFGVVSFDDGKFVFSWENIVEDLCEVAQDSEITGNRFDN